MVRGKQSGAERDEDAVKGARWGVGAKVDGDFFQAGAEGDNRENGGRGQGRPGGKGLRRCDGVFEIMSARRASPKSQRVFG